VEVPPPPFPGFDSFAVGAARIIFLLTAIASLGGIQIVTGLMCAAGPFFIGFSMFDATRGLFEGWVRVLSGTSLAAVGVSIALGLELALLEPWLASVLARRMAGETLPTVPTEVFVLVAVFAMIVLATLFACVFVTKAFRLPSLEKGTPVAIGSRQVILEGQAGQAPARSSAEQKLSRAAAIASVLVAANRREIGAIAGTSSAAPAGRNRIPEVGRSAGSVAHQSVPLGRSFNRRAVSRATASATRRDNAV